MIALVKGKDLKVKEFLNNSYPTVDNAITLLNNFLGSNPDINIIKVEVINSQPYNNPTKHSLLLTYTN